MAASNANITVTTAWKDVMETYPGLANVASYVQNRGPGEMLVYFSASGSAPGENDGLLVRTGGDVKGTAAHIWVKAFSGGIMVATGQADS